MNGFEDTIKANWMAFTDRSGDVVHLDYCKSHSDITCISVAGQCEETDWIGKYEEVPTVTLDDYIASKGTNKVDLLKIDVEGAEIMVLEGAKELINRDKSTVTCEFNSLVLERFGHTSQQLWGFWKTYGYDFFEYNHRIRRLKRCVNAPENKVVTYIGTTDDEWLAQHLGAKIY